MEYRINYAKIPPKLEECFNAPGWRQAETGCVNNFHPSGSAHHPDVRFRMVYNDAGLYLKFAAKDQYVLGRATGFQDLTCNDSCVEFLVQPDSGKGYVSFEMNCIGTLLSWHILNPARCDYAKTGKFFEEYYPLTRADLESFEIRSTFTEPVREELKEPVEYEVSLYIPFEVFRRAAGADFPVRGTVWRGNFFKCADESSHPHWASWNPIGKVLNFHQPEYFGKLVFA